MKQDEYVPIKHFFKIFYVFDTGSYYIAPTHSDPPVLGSSALELQASTIIQGCGGQHGIWCRTRSYCFPRQALTVELSLQPRTLFIDTRSCMLSSCHGKLEMPRLKIQKCWKCSSFRVLAYLGSIPSMGVMGKRDKGHSRSWHVNPEMRLLRGNWFFITQAQYG